MVEGDTVLVVDVVVTSLIKSEIIGDASLLVAGVVVLLDSTLEVGVEVADTPGVVAAVTIGVSLLLETGVVVLVDSTTGTVDEASVLETSAGLVLSDAGVVAVTAVVVEFPARIVLLSDGKGVVAVSLPGADIVALPDAVALTVAVSLTIGVVVLKVDDTSAGFFLYKLNLDPAPQYSYLFPAHNMLHCDSSVRTAPTPNVLPHQHSLPYSTPAYSYAPQMVKHFAISMSSAPVS